MHVCVYISCVGKNRLPKVMLLSEMKKRPAQISYGHTLVLHRDVIAFSLSTLLKISLGEFSVDLYEAKRFCWTYRRVGILCEAQFL